MSAVSEGGEQPVHPGLFTAAGLLGGAVRGVRPAPLPAASMPARGAGGRRRPSVTAVVDGTLWAWTAVTAPPPGYDGPVPYGFGVVELPADGLRVITRLTEPDPARLRVGHGRCASRCVPPLDDGRPVVTWAFEPAMTRAVRVAGVGIHPFGRFGDGPPPTWA